jgi:hypothetical protein
MRIRSRRVIAHKQRRVKARVQARHHATAPRPRPHNLDVSRKRFDQQVFSVAVRIAHHDLAGAGMLRRLNCCESFTGHEAAEPLIFETRRR